MTVGGTVWSGVAAAIGVLVGVAALQPGVARAEPPAAVVVRGPADGCPAAPAVARTLAALLRRSRVSVHEGPVGAAVVRLEDRGGEYRVALDGRVRVVSDPARDCTERTRVAAVVVAVTLDPPAVELPPPPPDSSAAREAPGAEPRLRVRVAAAGRVSGAPGLAGAPVTGGGSLRGLLGTKHFGISLGVGALAPAIVDLSTGQADVTRVPLDLSAYGAYRRGRLELDAQAGLEVAVLRVAGRGLDVESRASGVELGVRVAAALTVWLQGSLAPYVGVDVLVVPKPNDLVVASLGVVGHTPRVWLGGFFGVMARIR